MVNFRHIQQSITNGNWLKAEKFCEKILKKNPSDYQTLYLYGLVLEEKGFFSKAIQALGRVYKATQNEEVHKKLHRVKLICDILETKRDYYTLDVLTIDDKIRVIKHIKSDNLSQALLMAIAENIVGSHDINLLLSVIKAHKVSYFLPALHIFKKLLPNEKIIYREEGNFYISLKEFKKAEKSLEMSLKLFSDQWDVKTNLAYTKLQLNKELEAENLINSVLTKQNKNPIVQNIKGLIELRKGEFSGAHDSFKVALELAPTDAKILVNYATVLQELGDTKKSEDILLEAQKLEPLNQDIVLNMMELYDKSNQLDKLRKILDTRNLAQLIGSDHYFLRLGQLSYRLKDYEKAQTLFDKIDDRNLPHNHKVLMFELKGKLFDLMKNPSFAIEEFRKMNEQRVFSLNGKNESKRYLDYLDILISSWSKKQMPKTSSKEGTLNVAFCVGFPRSGTTLLDNALRSHRNIDVVEEVPILQNLIKDTIKVDSVENINNLTDNDLHSMLEKYETGIRKLFSKVVFGELIIDKMPLNLVHVGLIHSLFPNAKFVVSIRHPLDCILSGFMQNFRPNPAMDCFYTIETASLLYDKCMQLLSIYVTKLDLDVHYIRYEDLVSDFENQMRNTIKFLGHDWDENVLDFQRSALNRRVATPSYTQVAQPLYTNSSYRHLNYFDQLTVANEITSHWQTYYNYKEK